MPEHLQLLLSRCPLPPAAVLHLDLEHGDSCTQRPWHLARHQQVLCRASPPVFWGTIRALCASGSKDTTRRTQVSAPPRALSVEHIALERNEPPAAPHWEEAFPLYSAASASCSRSNWSRPAEAHQLLSQPPGPQAKPDQEEGSLGLPRQRYFVGHPNPQGTQ